MPTSIPAYRQHKPSGQAVVTLNGRDFYLGPWNSPESRQAYDRLLAEWMSHGRQLPDAVPLGELSVVELIAAYLEFAKTYYVREGEVTSEYVAVKHALKPVAKLYGRTAVKDFGPLALKAVRQTMIDQNLVRTHINLRINRIRRVVKWGVENELVPPSILEGLRAVAPLKKGRTTVPESRKVRPVPEAHVDAILPLVSRQVAAMIQLQRLTGMRPGEVVLLRPGDVDRSNRIWVYRPQRHKTDCAWNLTRASCSPSPSATLATIRRRPCNSSMPTTPATPSKKLRSNIRV